jgi:hypothetical protein
VFPVSHHGRVGHPLAHRHAEPDTDPVADVATTHAAAHRYPATTNANAVADRDTITHGNAFTNRDAITDRDAIAHGNTVAHGVPDCHATAAGTHCDVRSLRNSCDGTAAYADPDRRSLGRTVAEMTLTVSRSNRNTARCRDRKSGHRAGMGHSLG